MSTDKETGGDFLQPDELKAIKKGKRAKSLLVTPEGCLPMVDSMNKAISAAHFKSHEIFAREARLEHQATQTVQSILNRTDIDQTFEQIEGMDEEQLKYKIIDIASVLGAHDFNLDVDIEALRDQFYQYREIYLYRLSLMKENISEITHLWDVLGVPAEYKHELLSSLHELSEDALRKCSKEVESLCIRRNELLPTLVERKRQELADIKERIHVKQESKFTEDTVNNPREGAKLREYLFLESEISKYANWEEEYRPLYKAIEKRERIMQELANPIIERNPRKLSRRDSEPILRSCEETPTKRNKAALIHTERKITQMLLDFRDKTNMEFEYDGYPYIDRLSHKTLRRKSKPKDGTGEKRRLSRPPLPGETGTTCHTIKRMSPSKGMALRRNENENIQQQSLMVARSQNYFNLQ